MGRKTSELTLVSSAPSGAYVPVVDPNEANPANRDKRILVSNLGLGANPPASADVRFIEGGSFTKVAEEDFVYELSFDTTWTFDNGVTTHNLAAGTSFTIDPAAEGFRRFDLAVVDNNGDIVIVKGPEVSSGSVPFPFYNPLTQLSLGQYILVGETDSGTVSDYKDAVKRGDNGNLVYAVWIEDKINIGLSLTGEDDNQFLSLLLPRLFDTGSVSWEIVPDPLGDGKDKLQGNIPIKFSVEDAAEARGIGALPSGDNGVLLNIRTVGIFQWSSTSTAVDDGTTVIKPTAITHPAPGRWLLAGAAGTGISFPITGEQGGTGVDNTGSTIALNGSSLQFLGGENIVVVTDGGDNAIGIVITPTNSGFGMNGTTRIFEVGADGTKWTFAFPAATRTYTFPNKNGTVAMLDDISGGGGGDLYSNIENEILTSLRLFLNSYGGLATAADVGGAGGLWGDGPDYGWAIIGYSGSGVGMRGNNPNMHNGSGLTILEVQSDRVKVGTNESGDTMPYGIQYTHNHFGPGSEYASNPGDFDQVVPDIELVNTLIADAIDAIPDGGPVSFNDLTDVPDTLAGYGITDAATDAELAAAVAPFAITQEVHTSGSTKTITSAAGPIWLLVDPATILAALTITMPATPVDGQPVNISFGGTMTSGTVVTALTISPNTSQAILQATTPSTVEAGETITYRWKSSTSKWYRIS